MFTSCCGSCFGWETLVDDSLDTPERPQVRLDPLNMGLDAVIVKNGTRLCGTGGVIANAAIMQDKAYYEVKLQSEGAWGCGLASERCDLNIVPLKEQSWLIRSDSKLYSNGSELEQVAELNEGDVIGVSYDHVELQFYRNGTAIGNTITGIRGKVYPVLFVDDSAILDVEFVNFCHRPPSGYGQIMFEQSIL